MEKYSMFILYFMQGEGFRFNQRGSENKANLYDYVKAELFQGKKRIIICVP